MSPLPKRYDPQTLEPEILDFWKRGDVQNRTVKLRSSGPPWNFLEGPPTTNGFMHVGHGRGRAMKDAEIRYMTMKGFNVWRRGGWDMQGLPVELEVERKEGIAEKRQIETTIGLDLFVKKCKELVDYYLESWVNDSKRLGLWLDYESAYQTRTDDYIEHVWHFLKLASEKKLLGRGYRVNPTCPRCVTALSGHEVSQGYKTKVDPSIYVKFKLTDRRNEYLVIWTTTPFTLLSNEMVSVHPDFTYVKVQVGDEFWWLVENLVETVMRKAQKTSYQEVESLKGSEMLGWKYEHPFKDEVKWHQDHTEKFMHAVVTGTHVTVEDGTGLVHTAPGFGPDDFEVGRKYEVPVFCPVTPSGLFTKEVPIFEGQFVFDTNSLVPKMLKEKGRLILEETVEHEYPHCWRCDTPLVYLADKTQWFLKMIGVRERLVEENSRVEWTPEWAGTGRFGDWVANADDWCISRSRVWGSPLPVWVCDNCKAEVVIGSRSELKQRAVEFPKDFEMHRPWVDRVVLKCEKCGGKMHREPFVTDCWLDSGMAHTASVGYLRDQELFKRLFPYDFITEAVDQSRGWFYSLLYTSVVMHGTAPFKACVSQGHVLDEDGGKMSKSRGNVVWMKDALRDVGADLFRLYMLSKSAPWSATNYCPKEIEFTKKRLDVLWNVFLFTETYMELDRYRFNRERFVSSVGTSDLEDRWLVSRVQNVLKEFHTNMKQYLYHLAARALLDFVTEDLSRVYLPLVKKRVWLESDDPKKVIAYDTMFYALDVVMRCLNVFTPFLAEKLHKDFFTSFCEGLPESINLTDMPEPDDTLVEPDIEATFDVLQELRSACSYARNKKGVKLRHPVSRVIVLPTSPEIAKRVESLKALLSGDLNTRDLEVLPSGSVPDFTRLVVKPNYRTLGPKFKAMMTGLMAVLETADLTKLRADLQKGQAVLTVDGKDLTLAPEDLDFEESMPDHLSFADSKIGRVYVDTTRTRELEAEGLVRDVTRRVQVMRKEMDLNVEQRIRLAIMFSDKESVELAQMFSDYLATETRAAKMQLVGPLARPGWKQFAYVKEWELEDLKLKVGMSPEPQAPKAAPRKRARPAESGRKRRSAQSK